MYDSTVRPKVTSTRNQFRVSNNTSMHVFGLWVGTGLVKKTNETPPKKVRGWNLIL